MTAFAVAAHLDSDILIVDEVLSVGDAAFQEKCLGKMNNSVKGGKTVLFVSHSAAAIESICKTGIYLKSGKVQNFGDINTVMAQYKSDYKKNQLD